MVQHVGASATQEFTKAYWDLSDCLDPSYCLHKNPWASKRSPLQRSLCSRSPTQPLIGSNENKHSCEAGTIAVRVQHPAGLHLGAGQQMMPSGMFDITSTKSSCFTTMIYKHQRRTVDVLCNFTNRRSREKDRNNWSRQVTLKAMM